ncbi:MAG: hypothetical protein HY066_12005 [Betaproteobacteria bacterium]|nr:hypothetical protein [Betaproteobacteria bacterium]
MRFKKPVINFAGSLREIFSNALITLLAVAIAFSLPTIAKYILYDWWPQVEKNANLLLATEIVLTSVLVLLLNAAKMFWNDRQKVKLVNLSALAYARKSHDDGRIPRWRERALVRRLPAARDAFVMTPTGYDTFVDSNSILRPLLEESYEIRVMLVNPNSAGMQKRVASLPEDITLLSFKKEIEASIGYLQNLRKRGKIVTLKFFEHDPFWKLIVLGEHVWVQHCHSGIEIKHQPEYVFSLQHENPRIGLFVPFYLYFLNKWNEMTHPEYDFETNELIYRDSLGIETSRLPLMLSA